MRSHATPSLGISSRSITSTMRHHSSLVWTIHCPFFAAPIIAGRKAHHSLAPSRHCVALTVPCESVQCPLLNQSVPSLSATLPNSPVPSHFTAIPYYALAALGFAVLYLALAVRGSAIRHPAPAIRIVAVPIRAVPYRYCPSLGCSVPPALPIASLLCPCKSIHITATAPQVRSTRYACCSTQSIVRATLRISAPHIAPADLSRALLYRCTTVPI